MFKEKGLSIVGYMGKNVYIEMGWKLIFILSFFWEVRVCGC